MVTESHISYNQWTDMMEFTLGDSGSEVSVTLYHDDEATLEDLTTATAVEMDITRKGENALVSSGSVEIHNATNGIVKFTLDSTWFTAANLGGMSHYVAIFKITYASGQRKTLSMPVYVHLL